MSLFKTSEIYLPKYQEFVAITERHERAHWGTWEVKLDSDVEDWKLGRISEEDKKFVTTILRLFTQSDLEVGKLYNDYLIPVAKNNEARNMFSSFSTREGTHQRGYALISDTLGFGEDFYREFLDYKEMKDKVEFMANFKSNSIEDIIAGIPKQGLIEGVSLFAMFAMLMNYPRHGKLIGQGDVVQWSIRDESIHVEGLAAFFHQAVKEYPQVVTDSFKKDFYDTARECVKLEDAFIDLAFSLGKPIGITADECKQYVRAVCDYRAQQFGFKAQYNVENPFTWLDWVTSSEMQENFFEVNTTGYSKDSMVGDYNDAYQS